MVLFIGDISQYSFSDNKSHACSGERHSHIILLLLVTDVSPVLLVTEATYVLLAREMDRTNNSLIICYKIKLLSL